MKKSFKQTLLSTLFVSSLFLGTNAMAADYKQNPFTLTYDGAITENVQGKVNIQPVKYKINGIDIVANVYTPANFDPNKKYPAIVVAHPNGGVKEQVAGLYAQKLAEQGYVTIAFDAAYQGASGGKPRYVDKPANRIEDIRGAADFISWFKGVDPNRIGLLGICGGGGYSIKAAETDKRFKSVATISMFNSGDARRNGFMRSQTDNIQERLKQASNARAQEAAGGEILYTPAFAAGMTPEQVAALPYDLYRQGYEYYAQTHAHPNSQTNFTVSSLLDLMAFDVNTQVELISHSHGQYLIVTEGEGRTQEWGKPIQIIKKGDVIWCPPNVKHWHGAGEHSKMSHIAISPNAKENKATWLEKVELPKSDPKADLQKISQNTPLANKQLVIVPIAFYSARGDLEHLKPAIEQGLASGLTVNELREIFAHQYAYAGFPRALNGLLTLQNVLKERSEKGIQDPQGNPPKSTESTDYYTLGTHTLNTLSGRDNSAVLWNFDGVDYALKAHLFGYLFSRDNLSPVNRELVTVSTLAGLETVQNQLRSHLGILKNLGLNETELKRVIDKIRQQNPTAADKANEVLKEVFKKQ